MNNDVGQISSSAYISTWILRCKSNLSTYSEATVDHWMFTFGNIHILGTSLLFSYLKDDKTYGKVRLLYIKRVCHSFLQLLYKTFFSLINIWQVTLEMPADHSFIHSFYIPWILIGLHNPYGFWNSHVSLLS